MGLIAWAIVAGVGGLVITPLVAPLLPLIGFSTLGPVAGSLAAAAQSYVGAVAAGSFFAAAQAFAMTKL